MKDPRIKDLPLLYALGPQLDYLHYTHHDPDEFANDVTRLRMRLAPYQIGLLAIGLLTHSNLLVGLSLFLLVFLGLTDWIDGYDAYRHENSTDEGAQLDPRADKLVVLPNLVICSVAVAPTDLFFAGLMLITVGVAIKLDFESDTWYRENPHGKSNKFGKIKFGIHILVAAIGIAIIIVNPSDRATVITALTLAFLMMMANFFAQLSLQLKKQGLITLQEKRAEASFPSLIEGFAQSSSASID